ncbi:hypothetical protein K438DRAFT_1956406 [Mycena galopus ATCC 62051]|nr:hypothetical protein K438DRAFT_1956406 [Mycena galopus ATCC 62051]
MSDVLIGDGGRGVVVSDVDRTWLNLRIIMPFLYVMTSTLPKLGFPHFFLSQQSIRTTSCLPGSHIPNENWIHPHETLLAEHNWDLRLKSFACQPQDSQSPSLGA